VSIAADSPDLPVFTVEALEVAPVFDVVAFEKTDALDLGVLAAGLILDRGLDLAVDIVLGGDLVFRAKLGGTGPENDFWLAGKSAVAHYFGVPSLLVRRRHEAAGTRFEELDDPNVDHAVMRAHGGSIPLFVRGELVGTITVSGEPDVVDHQLAADALAAYLSR
jgi:uncharacterized protein (UPF0303 family)